MEDEQIKESIRNYFGEEELYSEQLKRRTLNGILKKQQKKRVANLLKKLTPVSIFLLLIGGGSVFYLASNNFEKQIVASTSEEELAAPAPNSDKKNDEILRETLNLSFRVISGMLNKDYEYLEDIIVPSAKLHTESNSFTFNYSAYEQKLMEVFDYNKFEYRGFHSEGGIVYIFLGVNNVSYEFQFVEDVSKKGNYLLLSYLTN